MTTLLDRYSKPCAHIYNNKVLLASTMEVIGVTLGDCVFGVSGEVKGKIFDKTLYAASGEMIATEVECKTAVEFNPLDILLQGWDILEKIKDHSCPWITPKDKWLSSNIEDFLKLQGTITVIRQANKKVLF
ncbi:MAG: hypothetical protein QM802_19540 [Agriterribacter sp.]